MSLARLAFPLVRPLLQYIDAERAHRLTIEALKLFPNQAAPASDPRLSVAAFGLQFPNPLGLAAGFDKNAEVAGALMSQGFGFIEVGTTTPNRQPGNDHPRLFRLWEDQAIINRMGFNSEGYAAVLKRLSGRQGGIIGVNIGANRSSSDRISDYVRGIETFAEVADYIAVNISSPNTPGLRSIQSKTELKSLLTCLNEARARLERRPPMLLKISPDLRPDELEDIVRCCEYGAVDGIIVSNTTTERPLLKSPHAIESGGLSGAPLFVPSTRMLARLFVLSDGRIPLVGVGGIGDADTAWAKIRAGATLLQLYSALVFEGPALIAKILDGLLDRIEREGGSLAPNRGRDAVSLTRD